MTREREPQELVELGTVSNDTAGDEGLPLEGSYSQYHFGRMKNYPKDVTTIVMPANGQPIGGLGEVGLSASSGAIANAWARATGRKPRSFPLNFPIDFTPFPPGKLPDPVVVPLQA